MSEEIDYAARVQRGITLLDQKWPAWATEINLDRLDIESDYSCMTAQYAASRGSSGWEDGMEMLGIDSSGEYAQHGFNGDYTYDSDGAFVGIPSGAYAALNGLWKAAIEARRAQAQNAPAEPEATA